MNMQTSQADGEKLQDDTVAGEDVANDESAVVALLRAYYDPILDEEIPQHLVDIVRAWSPRDESEEKSPDISSKKS